MRRILAAFSVAAFALTIAAQSQAASETKSNNPRPTLRTYRCGASSARGQRPASAQSCVLQERRRLL
jgi:hypothetical protein